MSGSALPTQTESPQQFEFTNDARVAEEFPKGLLGFAQSQWFSYRWPFIEDHSAERCFFPTFEGWSWRTRAAVIINQSSLHNLHNQMKRSGFIFQNPNGVILQTLGFHVLKPKWSILDIFADVILCANVL
jgi:hypothetical protein